MTRRAGWTKTHRAQKKNNNQKQSESRGKKNEIISLNRKDSLSLSEEIQTQTGAWQNPGFSDEVCCFRRLGNWAFPPSGSATSPHCTFSTPASPNRCASAGDVTELSHKRKVKTLLLLPHFLSTGTASTIILLAWMKTKVFIHLLLSSKGRGTLKQLYTRTRANRRLMLHAACLLLNTYFCNISTKLYLHISVLDLEINSNLISGCQSWVGLWQHLICCSSHLRNKVGKILFSPWLCFVFFFQIFVLAYITAWIGSKHMS